MRWLGVVIHGLSSVFFWAACRSSSSESTPAVARPVPTQLTGRQLARTYCGSCHLAPDPSLLDTATWRNGVLPQMALRMGQSDRQMSVLSSFSDTDELTRLIEADIFPERPTLHSADWQKIVTYYTTEAPAKPLLQLTHEAPRADLPLFRTRQSNRTIDGIVTLLRYDPVTHRIWAGDERGHLYALDQRLQRVDSVQFSSPPTDLYPHPDGSLDVLTVGQLDPNDRRMGAWNRLTRAGKTPAPRVSNLQRPVQATPADLNRDGRADVVICQFGHYLGKLTWHERRPDETGYREHIVDAVPGARRAIVEDVNRDGWPDVVALLTQGDEQVAVYYNQRNGSFRKETVLRFPPVYGSSYLELSDLDRDGDRDLIYTNGDNADYSAVPKAYHGVRIFLNNGRFRFRPAWFYPMHGASQTVVNDFDQDGDPDMAAIAYFPDYEHRPGESFIYFENQGKLKFTPRTFPAANRGRWLRMDAGDVDQDGDQDILLGSFARPIGSASRASIARWRQPGAGILLLENKLR